MPYKQYQPAAKLQNFIRYYWSFDSNHPDANHLVIQSFADRFPRFIFQDIENYSPITDFQGNPYPSCYLSGLDTHHSESLVGGVYSHFGVSFYPHALSFFFRVSAAELTDTVPDIEFFKGKKIAKQLQNASSHEHRVQLLNRYFEDRLAVVTRNEAQIASLAHDQSLLFKSLSQLSGSLHFSERTLERLFNQTIGVSPKKFQRIIRFEKALMLMQQPNPMDLTAMAYELGYADQSHFIKDFKTFSGITPSDFRTSQFVGTESSSFVQKK